jgi:hypothetical protein
MLFSIYFIWRFLFAFLMFSFFRQIIRKIRSGFCFGFFRNSLKSAIIFYFALVCFFGFQSFNIIKWIYEVAAEKNIATVSFYPSKCSVPTGRFDSKLGWWNIENVEGVPNLGPDALEQEFDIFNSAEYRGGEFEMECSGFEIGDESKIKTKKNKIIIKEIEKNDKIVEIELFDDEKRASTSIEILEKIPSATNTEMIVGTTTSLFASTSILTASSSEIASSSKGIIEKALDSVKDIFSYLNNKKAQAVKEHNFDYESNLGEFKNAKIKMSMMVHGTKLETNTHDSSDEEKTENRLASSTNLFTTQNISNSTKPASGTIQILDIGEVATSVIEILKEEDIKDNIISKLFKRLEVQAQENEEIALVMYYSLNSDSKNAVWQELDRFSTRSFSNSDYPDYLSYSAEFINDWQDIEDLSIKMLGQIQGETRLKMFWDNVWVEAEYEYDDELLFDTDNNPDRLELDEGRIDFAYTDENKDENLIIKTDKKTYFGLSSAKVYFNITNTGTRSEQLDIKSYFPENKGSVKELKRINVGEEYIEREPVFGPRSFFCESIWLEETASTSPSNTYSCIDTGETVTCDSLIASSSVCRQERSVIRHKNIIKKRIVKNWLESSEDKEKRNIFSILKKNKQKDVPEYFKNKENVQDPSYLYPGETAYYEMIIEYPFGSKGEFYIEAIGDNEGYGLLDPWWEQDWSYKLPITIDNTANDKELEYYQVLVEIASSSTDFWEHIKADGSDVRFVNQDETAELDFYEHLFIASTTAQYWVKVNSISTSSVETIYVYYSNDLVSSNSSAENTFSYATSTARFVAMGDYNPNLAAAGATFFDDNLFGVPGLYDSDWDTGATENPKVIANGYTADATVASSTKPFAITGDGGSGEMWAPLAWQSKEFVTTSHRDSIVLYFYNPNTATATVTLYRNGSALTPFELDPEEYYEETGLTYTQDDHWRVSSTEPILLYQAGGAGGVYDDDIIAVPPPANNWHGVVRNTRIICSEDDTAITIYFSDSTTESKAVNCSADEVWVISKTGGTFASGATARVVADKPVFAWSSADGDGYEKQSWYSDEDLDVEYLIPDDYSYLLCSAPYDNTTVRVYNMSGTQQVSSGDLGSNGDYPHKWLDNNTRTGGMRIMSDLPVYCYYDQTPGSAGSDENNAANRVINRKGTWPHPSVSVGDELIIDNPIVEQSSFRWYANENKSELGYVFSEALAYKSTTEQSSFVNVVTASSSEFVGGDTYLIYVQAGFGGSVADVTTDFEVSYGASAQYTGLVEGPGDAYDAYQVSWFDVYTQPATPEDIKLNYRTNNGASYVLNAQIIAINLSDISANDYKYDSDTSASTHATSPSWDNRASITLDQADGDKDWLVLATEEVEVNSTGISFQGEIYDESSSYMGTTIEGEDSDELLPYTLIRSFEDVTQNTTYTLRTRDDDTGVNNHLRSRLFAINLDAFESKKVYSADINTAITDTDWTEVGNLNSSGNYQPQMSGTQILFSSYINEHDGSSEGIDFRLMVDSATSSPEWSWRQNVIPSRTNHDFDDELINTIVGVAEIDSSGAPISMDAIELSGTAQIADEISMTVFSTLLKTATSTLANADITPDNPWPAIGSDFDEDTAIDSGGPGQGDVLRLRLALHVTNASATPGSLIYKLQYGEGTNCSAVSAWTDVGKLASTTIWRGYDNTNIVDAATIATTVLSISDVGGSYEEENNSTSTKNEVGVNEDVEWDWVIENNGASPATSYCFRMVNSDGTELDSYSSYPKLLTNASVDAPTLGGVFDMEKTGDTTPSLTFGVSDSDDNDLVYQISWSVDYSFVSSSSKQSDLDSGFVNTNTPADLNPFNSGDTIRFTVEAGDSLSNNSTYYWRVRAKDSDGSNIWGTWSEIRSFTVDTGVGVTTWHQTTDEQFDNGEYTNRTYTEGSDRVVVVPKIAEYGTTTLSGETPSVINLNFMYDEPIIVATPRYWDGPTRSVRVYNKTSTSFTVMVDDYDDTLGTRETGIDYMVMEAGTWTVDDGASGFQVVASSSLTAGIGGGGATAWDVPVMLYYDSVFTSAPVVIHNISSNNDSGWIASNVNDGSTHTTEPTISQIGFLMNRGKDLAATHDPETIDWLAFEPGTGTNNGVGYALINAPDGTISGFADSPPYTVNYAGAFSSLPAVELSSQLGEDGGDGSFSIYYGDFASSSISAYYIALDEGDSVGDRAHTQEPASVVAFESGGDNTISVLDDLSGIYTSPSVSYSLGTNVAGWDNIFWDVSTTSGDFYMQVEYNTGSSWALVPDINIPGNSSGLCCSPVDISSLNVYTYNELRLKAYLSLETSSARLNDWTIEWKEPIRFEGIVYSDLGDTPLLTEPTVSLAVDGVFIASSSASSIDGSFSITYGDYLPAGSSTILYLDNSTEKGAVINYYIGEGHVQDIEIYQNTYIVRNDYNNSINNTDIDEFDQNQDSDIEILVNGNDLSASSSWGIYIWPNTNYIPGGMVTLSSGLASTSVGGDLYIASTTSVLNIENNNLSIGSDLINNGTFVRVITQTTYFTATGTDYSINIGTSSFANLVINNTGFFNLVSSTTVAGDLNIATGTLNTVYNLTVNGGDLYGNGILNSSVGTTTLNESGNFGGYSNWTFDNLIFGSGSSGASTKVGEGDIIVNNNLYISTNQTLNAGSSNWQLTSAGSPFNVAGTFTADSSRFRFSAAEDTLIPALTYDRLVLSPAGSGNPVYTLEAGTLATGDYLNIGYGVYPLTFDASTTNAAIHIGGDISIANQAYLLAPRGASFSVGGDWINQGTFVSNQGKVLFDSSTANNSIYAGQSSFYDLEISNSSGSWTIEESATTTNNFTISAAESLLASTSIFIEVQGQFWNGLNSASSTWNNSTLFLNASSSISYAINASSTSDYYPNLKIGSTTQVRMWNSSSSNYFYNGEASLYSMDHNNRDGELYIFGQYVKEYGTDYWSYATDFDGSSLSGGMERQAKVFIASSSLVQYSASNLEMIGVQSASTTISNQGLGRYEFKNCCGSVNANYYQIRDIDSQGWQLRGNLTVTSIDNGDFLLEENGATLLTISSTTIDYNSAKTISGLYLASTTDILGYSALINGTAGSFWQFTNYFGQLGGEAHDSDYGGVCGALRWLDSDCTDITLKHYRWRNDNDSETLASWKNYEDTITYDQAKEEILRLRFSVDNEDVAETEDVYYKLQTAALAGFAACTSVPSINYHDVATTSMGSNYVLMATSSLVDDQDPSTAQLSSEGTFRAGYIVEYPNNTSAAINLQTGEYTEIEYVLEFTDLAKSNAEYCFRLVQNDIDFNTYDEEAEIEMIGLTVYGNAYDDDLSVWNECDGTTGNLSMNIAGAFIATTTCNPGSGYYEFTNIDFNDNDPVSVYFNNIDQANTVTLTNNNYTDLALYLIEDQLWLRSEDSEEAITNTHLDMCDTAICRNAGFTVDGNNLVASTSMGVKVGTSTIFRPGGNITLPNGSASSTYGGDIVVLSSGTLNMDAYDLSIGSDMFIGGTFSRDLSQTISFTATGSQYRILAGGNSLANVSFRGEAGSWAFLRDTTINGDLSIASGTLYGTTSLSVYGGRQAATE